MALDLISKLDSLAETHGCVYDALVPILDTCMAPENTRERICISIRLSICEFISAGIEYPEVCNDLNSAEKCTQSLESKPTWWTTFSGNYRQIPVICQEFRPNYESHKLISTFHDSVNIFQQYQDDLQTVLKNAASASDTLNSVWKAGILNLRTEVDVLLNEIIASRSAEKQYMQSVANDYSAAVQHVRTEFKLVDYSIADILEKGEVLKTEFDLFSSNLNDIQLRQEENVEYLNQEIHSSTSLLAEQSHILSSIVDYFKPIKYILNAITVFAAPIALLIAFVVLRLVLRKLIGRKEALKNTWPHHKQDAVESVPDYLFY